MLLNNEKDPVLQDLSQITVNALKDLEMARTELQANDEHMKEMNKLANERVDEMSRVNQQLQGKISFVENVAKTMQEKNEKLENDIRIVKREKDNNHKLNKLLKTDFEKVVKKEKSLTIKQMFLEKKIEEQSQNLLRTEKMSIIGQFTSRLAHDIRNPLSKLKMSHDILCSNPNLAVLDKVKHQQRIDKAITKMVHVIEDVLEFVRMSDLTIKETSLDQIISSTMDGIEIPSTVNVEVKNGQVNVLCDVRKLEAVFVNLIANALDAIDNKGYIKIGITSNDENVEIEFEDSGEGVHKESESKIFEPMYTTKTHGSGLGLAICKMIVEQHGGRLVYRNHPSVFSVILPKIINSKNKS